MFSLDYIIVSLCTVHKNLPITNGLPDDEHTMFETRKRHEELN